MRNDQVHALTQNSFAGVGIVAKPVKLPTGMLGLLLASLLLFFIQLPINAGPMQLMVQVFEFLPST